MTARKIIVYIATSADGYIARRDGSVDWLNRPRTAGDYGMRDFFKTIDTILRGRATYDQSLGFARRGARVTLVRKLRTMFLVGDHQGMETSKLNSSMNPSRTLPVDCVSPPERTFG